MRQPNKFIKNLKINTVKYYLLIILIIVLQTYKVLSFFILFNIKNITLNSIIIFFVKKIIK